MTDEDRTPGSVGRQPKRDQPRHLADLASGSDRPPIVLVPGLDGTALLFYRQIPHLARAFDVVAFPLPDNSTITFDGLVSDLRRLISEVSDNGAILVGESFGGALSMSTALAHPEAVKGLVIVNSFPWLKRRIQIRAAPWLLRLLPWGAMPIVRSFTESRLHSRHTLDEDLVEFHRRSAMIGYDGYVRRLELLAGYDIRHRLSAISCPTLFLAADEDRLVPSVEWAQYMAARVPDSELSILEGYGHICLINHDLDLLDYVEPWWSDLDTVEKRGTLGSPRSGPPGPMLES